MIALIVLAGLALAIGALIGLTMVGIAAARVLIGPRKATSSTRTREPIHHLMTPSVEAEFQRIVSAELLNKKFDR